MSIIIKNLTLKNFLSIGAVVQAIDFDKKDLTLILGENLDLGGDGNRNGTGKTTIIQGLSYALFGSAINQIKKDNLINGTNNKNMVVTVDFSVNNIDYQIIRGRKPNLLKLYINNQEQKFTDDSQGDSRETQDVIERILNMSPDMFKQIIALNTYNEPFLAMKVSDQRMLIEQLLGITLLSEKAETIKELNRKTKEEIQLEEFRIKGIETANLRINEQIESLKKRQQLWDIKYNQDINDLVSEYNELSIIDIDQELKAHKDLSLYKIKKDKLARYDALLARQTIWQDKKSKDLLLLEEQLNCLYNIDIDHELLSHKNLMLYNELVRNKLIYDQTIEQIQTNINREEKNVIKIETEIKILKDHKCYACGQEFHDTNHNIVLNNKNKSLSESKQLLIEYRNQLTELNKNPITLIDKPNTYYSSEAEAIRHSSEIDKIKQQIVEKNNEIDPYIDQLNENIVSSLGPMPITQYDTEEEAFKHSSRIETLISQLDQKSNETNPYTDQISEMESNALETIDYEKLNNLNKLLQHQDFLLDLLTNKKSFVRKIIIERNLSYLNSRLTFYLDKLGLPHQVIFQNDLSVEITELGRSLDFDNLSRGERNRLILGLSFAFRDVWESLYTPINILFIDELIDSGLDTVGVENSLGLLKEMTRRRNKSIWLVSHREELTNRVSSVLKVIKEGGFTSYSVSADIVE